MVVDVESVEAWALAKGVHHVVLRAAGGYVATACGIWGNTTPIVPYDPWAKVEYVEITYTTAVRKGPASRKNREVLISPLSFASGRPQTQQMEDATCAAT